MYNCKLIMQVIGEDGDYLIEQDLTEKEFDLTIGIYSDIRRMNGEKIDEEDAIEKISKELAGNYVNKFLTKR